MDFLKNLFIIYIILLFVNNPVFGQQKDSLVPTKYYFENNQVSSEGFLRNGKPDGYWKSYHRNGTLITEGNRKNYLLDGTWKFYTETGQLQLEINYAEDKKDGNRITYRGKKPFKIEPFKNDVKHGITQFFYPSGKIEKEIPFVEGREKGLGYQYDSTGTIISLFTFKGGVLVKNQEINRIDKQGLKKGLWMDFHANRTIKSEGIYVNDLKHGYWKYYKNNGNLIRIEKWVHGVLIKDAEELAKIEVRREIDPNTGRLKSMGGYRNGVKEGVHREYDENGNVINAQIYKNGIKLSEGIIDEQGRKQKLWKYFYTTGEIKEQGKYKNNKKIGTWKYFFANGEIEQIGDYRNGRADGIWRWYFENKEIRLEEEYIDGFEDGPSTEYDENGNVIAQGNYIEGFKDGRWTYSIGNIVETGEYFEGEKQGIWTATYKDNNKKAFTGEFLNGVENGMHTTYFANGQVEKRGRYSLGLRDGIWEFFTQTGTLRLTIKYKNGKELEYNGKKISYGKRADRELEAQEQNNEIQQ